MMRFRHPHSKEALMNICHEKVTPGRYVLLLKATFPTIKWQILILRKQVKNTYTPDSEVGGYSSVIAQLHCPDFTSD